MARKNLRLMAQGESLEGSVALPVARLRTRGALLAGERVFVLRFATVAGAGSQVRNVTFTFASSSTRYSNDLEATNGSQPGSRGNLDARAGQLAPILAIVLKSKIAGKVGIT